MKKSQKEAILRILEYIIKLLRFPDLIVAQECCECLETIHNVVEDKAIQNYIEIILEEYKESNFIKESKIVALIRLVDNSQEQLEVFFLPYKASMWDAMESVYLHAIQDVRADVKIMPIPYISFDKETGSVHHHYEGDSFKHYDEYVHYDECDLEEERPDIIFIHNPYDDKNLVTRIDEKYFSSNLVKYTQHLVYIPYDVVVGDQIDRNYCLMPGVQNAWRVYVQSEKIRQEYIRCNRSDKVVALGSPKIDAVVNTTKSSVEIPEEWKVKIGDKKVILFNTHLAGILSEANKTVQRIQDIGDYFKNHSNWVLLWRPHPLSIQTAEAMNPQFLKVYLALVNYMKSISNVIYDDTADMDRAMVISDAYIGDQSSLVLLYGVTGKPMYLHSGFNRKPLNYNEIYCQNGVIDGDSIWLSHMYYNALYKINLKNMYIEEMLRIPCEGKNEEALFGKLFCIGNSLLLVPSQAENFVWYDRQNGIFSNIPYESVTKGNLFSVVAAQNYLYLFAYCADNPSVRINILNKDIEYFYLDYSSLRKNTNVSYDYLWAKGGGYVEQKCWLAMRQFNGIVSISQNGKMEFYTIDASQKGFKELVFDGENFWLIPILGSEIICWNNEKGILKKFDLDDGDAEEKALYEGIICTDDNIWIIPSSVLYIGKISRLTGTIQKIPIPIENSILEERDILFSGYQLWNNFIYLFPYSYSKIIKIDIKSLEIYYEKIDMEINQWKNDFAKSEKGISTNHWSDYVYRDTVFSLDEFLDVVENDTLMLRKNRKRSFSNYAVNMDGVAGSKIWNSIMEEFGKENDN